MRIGQHEIRLVCLPLPWQRGLQSTQKDVELEGVAGGNGPATTISIRTWKWIKSCVRGLPELNRCFRSILVGVLPAIFAAPSLSFTLRRLFDAWMPCGRIEV